MARLKTGGDTWREFAEVNSCVSDADLDAVINEVTDYMLANNEMLTPLVKVMRAMDVDREGQLACLICHSMTGGKLLAVGGMLCAVLLRVYRGRMEKARKEVARG
jgi:hypothetical protein